MNIGSADWASVPYQTRRGDTRSVREMTTTSKRPLATSNVSAATKDRTRTRGTLKSPFEASSWPPSPT